MGTENKTVGLFLFGEVYKEHWKTQVGCVVALLNPNIMKQEKGVRFKKFYKLFDSVFLLQYLKKHL